jgi:heme-degrading monooxygenase HmoA
MMYAVVRRIVFVPGRPEQRVDDRDEVRTVHERQPGFVGTLDIDEGDGRHVVVNLWESVEAAEAGRRTVGPVAARTMEQFTAQPPELLAVGEVSTALVVRRTD